MNIQNLVRASAQIVQITELAKGDAVKIIEESYSSAEIKYGIVLDVLNDWDKGFVQMLLIKSNYNEIKKEIKLISAKSNESMAIFPSSIEEIKAAFSDTVENAESKYSEKVEELKKLRESIDFAKDVISGAQKLVGNTPKFITLPSSSL